MNASRRTFLGGALALACASRAAAPRERIVQLKHTSVFFAPHLTRMKRLCAGTACRLEAGEHGVMVLANGQILGLLGQVDAVALGAVTEAQIHRVWMSAANTTFVSIRLEMRRIT
jgi:hypothetical protein